MEQTLERPRVLVAFASRHGATREIAAALARSLPRTRAGARSGMSTVLAPVQAHPDPAEFDAVVIGSAVYAGRWLGPARDYVAAAAPSLEGRPTWLFSSGLRTAFPSHAHSEWQELRGLTAVTGARGHRCFPGRLERRLLRAHERHDLGHPAAVGDHRDLRATGAWADDLAAGIIQAGANRLVSPLPDRYEQAAAPSFTVSL